MHVSDFAKFMLAVNKVDTDDNDIAGTCTNAVDEPIDMKVVDEFVRTPFDEATWKSLETARRICDGNANAPRIVYVITDPNCSWRHQLWTATRPRVASGKVHWRRLLVGVIGADSEAKAAAILSTPNPLVTLDQSKSSFVSLKAIPNDARQALQANATLTTELGSWETPAIVYRGADSTLLRRLEAFLGGKRCKKSSALNSLVLFHSRTSRLWQVHRLIALKGARNGQPSASPS